MMKRYMAGTLLCLAALLAGCNGGGSNGGGGGSNEISVSVNPPGVITQLNQTVQFAASVVNAPTLNIASSNGAVRSSNVVTITTTTPHGFQAGQTVTINAVTDVSFTGTFIITSAPTTTTLTYAQVGSNATSGGGTIPHTAVTWQVNNTTGGNAMVGTIDVRGLYTAPSVLVPAVTATIAPQGAVRASNSVTITTTAAHTFTVGQIVSITNVTAVNPLTATITANGAVRAANSVTITTTAAHSFTPGQVVTITGVTDASFNGAFLILSTPSATTFTFSQAASDANSGGGMASTPVASFNGTFLIATVPSTTTFTYAQNGANATSGGGTASSAAVQVKAISVADTTKEGTASVVLDSGITLTLSPAAVTIATGEQVQFTVTNTGPTSTAFNWFVDDVAGGSASLGMITAMTPAGATSTATYTAPGTVPAPASVTIKAQAVADATKSVTAVVTISMLTAPTLVSISPTTVAQGSAFHDFYLVGTNFLTTTKVQINGIDVPNAPTAITPSLLRVRVPASFFDVAGTMIPVTVSSQNGPASMSQPLDIAPQRPALISTTPDSVRAGQPGTLTVSLTGGYFGQTAPTVMGEFNGSPATLSPLMPPSSTQIDMVLNSGQLTTPGLFSLGVRHPTAAQPLAARNLAVQPTALPSIGGTVLTGGMMPSAASINPATGIAVVANRGSGDITRIDLATNAVVGAPITVGGVASSAPTGVAVNFLHDSAITANSGTNNISIVNLGTAAVTNLFSPTGPAGVLKPVAVAVNPVSGMALVANQSTNLATLVDTNSGVVVAAVPGVNVGLNPEVAVDTRLNWAIVTPGGAGTVSIVDLGRGRSFAITGATRTANVVTVTTPAAHGLLVGDTVTLSGVSVPAMTPAFDGVFTVVSVPSTTTFTYAQTATDATGTGGIVGHHPGALATVAVGVTVRGVAVNSETHTAFMVDPTTSTPLIFSLLDQTVTAPQTGSGYTSAAVNPLTNIGIQANFGTNQIQAVDLRQPAVIAGSLLMVGTGPRAVAIDPGSNVAVVANETSNDVTIVNLGQLRGGTGPHIVQSAPLVTMTSGADLTLFIAGSNLSGGSVRLDGTALATTVVNSRFLSATVPAAMLSSVRRYNVDVQVGTEASNVSELSVIQAVAVGTAPAAVAVDSEHNVALVANSADDNVSIINLGTGLVVGTPVMVGDNPQGVAVIPRLGRAVVTNLDSDNATLVPYFDLTTNMITTSGTTVNVVTGNGPLGVAINPNDAQAVVANSLANTVSLFNAAATATPISITTTVETRPTAVVIDPVRNLAAITHTTSNSVVLLNLPGGSISARTGVTQLPEGVVYDPDSDRFVVAAALSNNLTLVNPNGAATQIVRVGINPTSIAYNRHSSTLVTVNSASNTMSVMDFKNLRVREVLSVQGASRFAVAINEQTNVAVVVDQANNRVLLIQLPR